MTPEPSWVDVSVPVHADMPTWPEDPRAWVKRIRRLEDEDPANVSVVSMPTHAGTHVDAPRHVFEKGATVDQMPPDAGLGEAFVAEVDDLDAVRAEHVDALPEGVERVLFKTDNSVRCWQSDDFVESYVHLTREAAEALAERGVRLVGVDYLSVGAYDDARNLEAVHEALLGNGVWIVEGLDLSEVEPGPVELACMPLRVQGGDGAPARAMVRELA